ncbi:MAG: hypothetical protein AABY22_20495, partial [Nanoarchaeota archaeon]
RVTDVFSVFAKVKVFVGYASPVVYPMLQDAGVDVIVAETKGTQNKSRYRNIYNLFILTSPF